jgi:nitrate reductase NapAB chaperone NapD
MTKKTHEQHTREATESLRPLMEQAEAMPGVMDVIAVMERFDTSNEGAATYARAVENVVYFTATSSTR